MKALFCSLAAAMFLAAASLPAEAQTPVNYDESKVPEYVLPDALTFDNGREVRNKRQWKRRREEIIEAFASEMYGHVPARPKGLHFATVSEEKGLFDGVADKKVVRIFLDKEETHSFDVLIYMPAKAEGPVPMMVGLNFGPQETEPGGRNIHRWQFEMACREGIGVATAWHNSIEPDEKDTKQTYGLRYWYGPEYDWGAISAWSWALSRIMDYFETDPAVDCRKVTVMGHSRLGKTSLWAGANDLRFAAVISNNSGCCGAAISRRKYGETFERIGTSFPYWFVSGFDKYFGKEEMFPGDQHELAALIAPRPLYIASAKEDRWADPEGEWLCACEAGWIYEKIFGLRIMKHVDSMPAVDEPDDDGVVAYKIRSGAHDVLAEDWASYIAFVKKNLVDRK